MKNIVKNTLLFMLLILVVGILYYGSLFLGATLLSRFVIYLWENLPTYCVEFNENQVIKQEDKQKIIEVLELNSVPESFEIINMKYSRSHDGDDAYYIDFKIDNDDVENFEKANIKRASNIFFINKEIKDNYCIYKYNCASEGGDKRLTSIYKIVLNYEYSVER